MGLVTKDDGWRIPDELWAQIHPMIPVHKTNHPLGCHRRRTDDRVAMNAILFVLRTGCQWNALNATGICSSSAAHRRFLEWVEDGVCEQFRKDALLDYDATRQINWSWLAMDGAMTKPPLAGSKNGGQPDGSRQAQPVDRCQGYSSGSDHRRSQPS